MIKQATNTQQPGQKIAVIGGGIAGLTAAYLLSEQHMVSLFEANDYLGGHTHTEDVTLGGQVYPVNTGFIVFNDWTYPNFIKLLDRLGVASEQSDMSFSVRCENTGLEYNGTSLNSLYAQRMNMFNPRFARMVYDILRFNRETTAELQEGKITGEETLGEYVNRKHYSRSFVNHYIVPMGAAIWSSSEEAMMAFPLKFFLRFFNNHGMLSVDQRPTWRVLTGGSRSYIAPISQPFQERVHLNCPVETVLREDHQVTVVTQGGKSEVFDQVIFACHSDQALKMLGQPTPEECAILGALPYQENQVTLHTDVSLMPRKKLAWASWNYHIPQRANQCAMVTYNMNMLQNFHEAPETILVTLNRANEIRPDKIINEYRYSHPVFTLDGMAAQEKHDRISNHHRTHYCGAYWFNGFHEDGVNSALRVVKAFGVDAV